jgi:chromatin segregation and condensation protein Rec8/ScpA/Scc1 (kleisin family)
VATFLAVLELYRRGLIVLDQAEVFGELQIGLLVSGG